MSTTLPTTLRAYHLRSDHLVDHPFDREEELDLHFRLHPTDGRRRAEEAYLGDLATALPHHRDHLDHGAIEDRFGADPASMDAVAGALKKLGLSEKARNPRHRELTVKAPLGAVERALGVDAQAVKSGGQVFRSFHGPIRLDNDLAGRIADVRGLETAPSVLPRTHATGFSGHHYAVRDVATLYGCPLHATGQGQTVVILALGGGFHRQDLKTYFDGLGLAVPTVKAEGVNGAANNPASSDAVQSLLKGQNMDSVLLAGLEAEDGGSDMVDAMWTVEITSDIQVLGSMVPDAKIVVIFGANNPGDQIAALRRALSPEFEKEHGRPTVISCSWGQPESSLRESNRQAINDELVHAAALGVTVCCASGDSGGGFVYFPASSPYALACGGTAILTPPDRRGREPLREAVWREVREGRFFSSSGGGFSSTFSTPEWQGAATGNWGGGHRGVPDLAAQASLATGYALVVGNSQVGIGGTSAAAPLIAGLVSQIIEVNGGLASDYRIGWLTPLLYRPEFGSAFFPINRGTNGLYNAVDKWDPCSGLGRPIGHALARALAGVKASSVATSGAADTSAGSAGSAAPPSAPSAAPSTAPPAAGAVPEIGSKPAAPAASGDGGSGGGGTPDVGTSGDP